MNHTSSLNYLTFFTVSSPEVIERHPTDALSLNDLSKDFYSRL